MSYKPRFHIPWRARSPRGRLPPQGSATTPTPLSRTSRPPRRTIHRLSYCMPMPSRTCSRASLYSSGQTLIREHKLHGELNSHELNKLAKKAKVTVDQQNERPVLEALTHLSTWAA